MERTFDHCGRALELPEFVDTTTWASLPLYARVQLALAAEETLLPPFYEDLIRRTRATKSRRVAYAGLRRELRERLELAKALDH